MRRCRDSDWLVSATEEPLDPDVVTKRIQDVAIFTDTPVDSFWPFLREMDPQEEQKSRRWQKAYLARYGRISPFEWEHRDTSELDQIYRDIAEIIRNENTGIRSEDS